MRTAQEALHSQLTASAHAAVAAAEEESTRTSARLYAAAALSAVVEPFASNVRHFALLFNAYIPLAQCSYHNTSKQSSLQYPEILFRLELIAYFGLLTCTRIEFLPTVRCYVSSFHSLSDAVLEFETVLRHTFQVSLYQE